MNPPKTPDRPTVSPLAHQTFTPCTRLSRMTLGPATDDPPRPFQEGWMEEKVRGEERSLDKKRVRPSLGGSDGGGYWCAIAIFVFWRGRIRRRRLLFIRSLFTRPSVRGSDVVSQATDKTIPVWGGRRGGWTLWSEYCLVSAGVSWQQTSGEHGLWGDEWRRSRKQITVGGKRRRKERGRRPMAFTGNQLGRRWTDRQDKVAWNKACHPDLLSLLHQKKKTKHQPMMNPTCIIHTSLCSHHFISFCSHPKKKINFFFFQFENKSCTVKSWLNALFS